MRTSRAIRLLACWLGLSSFRANVEILALMASLERIEERTEEHRIQRDIRSTSSTNSTNDSSGINDYNGPPMDTPGKVNSFVWAMAISIFASALLLGVHSRLRFEDQPRKGCHWTHDRRRGYNDDRFGKFYRAASLCAGAMSTCAMALYCMVRSQQGSNQYFLVYQGLMAFWTGYWIEWWTTILRNRLDAYGC